MKIFYTVLAYDDDTTELVVDSKQKAVADRLKEEGHTYGYKKFIHSVEVKGALEAFTKGFEIAMEED